MRSVLIKREKGIDYHFETREDRSSSFLAKSPEKGQRRAVAIHL